MAGKRALTITRPRCNGDGNGEDDNNDDNGGGNGNGGIIDVYYNAGCISDDTNIFSEVARMAVDAAIATADQGDDDAGCNEDPFACTSPATAAATTPLSPAAGATMRQRAGPPLSGVVAYFSTSLDEKD